MNSALYTGWVSHRRLKPAVHAFRYRHAMLYIDLSELDNLFHGRWLWGAQRWAVARWRRADYLGDARLALAVCVHDCVQQATGRRPAGPVRLLTQLAHFGYSFNPVRFYYCFDAGGSTVEAIVAEITNTPWGERHTYVVAPPLSGAQAHLRQHFAKAFHVSPFLPMALDYDWRFSQPSATLEVNMLVSQDEQALFHADMYLQREEISGASLSAAVLRFPAANALVLARIYWQAMRLWLKRAPFHSHPRAAPGATSASADES